MQLLFSLIDKASNVCGSDANLARTLDISRAYMSQMRSGVRPVTPAIAGVLAHIAGEDILPAVIAATMDQLSTTERGKVVRAELEKRFLGGEGGTFGISTTHSATKKTSFTDEASSQFVNKLYIVSSERHTPRGLRPLWARVAICGRPGLPGEARRAFRLRHMPHAASGTAFEHEGPPVYQEQITSGAGLT